MTTYPSVTKEDLIKLSQLVEHQKIQRAHKIKNRILERTHDMPLAKFFSPLTENLEEVIISTQKVGVVLKDSNSENDKIKT